MRVYLSQVYVEAGSRYPFSQHFQVAIREEINSRIEVSEYFSQKYGKDCDLIFRMSAKSSLVSPEVRGPTWFAEDKDVEYTIFLPFCKYEAMTKSAYHSILLLLLDQIIHVLEELEINTTRLTADSSKIAEQIVDNPSMFTAGWHWPP